MSARVPCVELVLNPRARRLRDGSRLRRTLVAEAERGGAWVHAPADLGALSEIARVIALRRPDVVLIAGGDGTLMRALSALAQAFEGAPLPVIGVVPAGTVGTVARSFGLHGAAAASAVVRAAFAPERPSIQVRPTLRVRVDADGPGGGRRRGDDLGETPAEHVGFIFGAGLVAQFFDVYRAQPRPGLPAAALIAARVFGGSFVGASLARRVLARTPCTLSIDGEPHPAQEWSLIVASRVRDLGLHFLVTYRGAEEIERFHVVGSGLPVGALGPQMFRVLAGRPLRGEPRVDALARSLRVRFRDGPGAYVLDGDVFMARDVVVDNGPAVRILAP